MASQSDRPEAVLAPEAARAEYAQFALRELDKLSWLAPLVNNRIGQLLRIQLRHEHLFFLDGTEVVEEIGYGEDGRRFHERDMGKPIPDLEAAKAGGYWLIPPKLDAQAAFDAVQETEDGAYYSVFSNQCQDWAHRVRQRALALEKARGIAPGGGTSPPVKAIAPTVPAAWYFGVLALLAGLFGLLAPAMAGFRYLNFIAILLCGIGISDGIYAFSSKAWTTFLSTAGLGLAAFLGGLVLWANGAWLLNSGNGILGVVLGIIGLSRIGIAIRSRPFSAWAGTFVSGWLMLGSAWIAWVHREGAAGAWLLGVAISVSFLSAGVSTIWLNWKLSRTPAG